MIFRTGRRMFAFLPYMMFVNYCQVDREYSRNIKRIRDFCQNLIDERRKNLDKFKDSSDLLTILLHDEIFQGNDKAMVDEIITFFLAGSFTLKTTNSNMI